RSSISTFIDRIHEKHYGHTTKSTLSSNTDHMFADHGTVHPSLEAWNIKKICAERCTKEGGGGGGETRSTLHLIQKVCEPQERGCGGIAPRARKDASIHPSLTKELQLSQGLLEY
ncbi:unnamed protein product, partial [Ixodes pacificus]